MTMTMTNEEKADYLRERGTDFLDTSPTSEWGALLHEAAVLFAAAGADDPMQLIAAGKATWAFIQKWEADNNCVDQSPDHWHEDGENWDGDGKPCELCAAWRLMVNTAASAAKGAADV